MDDIRAVMDAVGLERAVLYGLEDGAAVCFLFAATYPERTQAVITSGASPRGMWSPETPWIWTAETWEEEIEETRQGWGTQAFTEAIPCGIFPSRVNDQEFVRQYGRVMRQAMGRADAIAASRMWRDTDVEHVLPLIQAPTLVMHYVDDKVEPIETGRYIADHIPGAVLAELPGADHSMGDVAVVDQFLASLRAEEQTSTGSWPQSCSPTSSTPPPLPPSLATTHGANSSSATMPPCVRCSAATAAPRWTPPATDSSPPSTAQPAASAVPKPSPAQSSHSDRSPRRPAHRRG